VIQGFIAQEWQHFYGQVANSRELPLHNYVCRCDATVIDLLLEQSHSCWSTMVHDASCNVPLHYAVQAACSRNSPLPCVHAEASESAENLPHYLEMQDHMDILTSLVSSSPPSSMVSNQRFETPISLWKASNAVSTMLVRTCKAFKINSSMQHQQQQQPQNPRVYFATDYTFPSSSHSDVDPLSSMLLTERDDFNGSSDIDWDDHERQAVGERPR
jgi:hypothetical protein